MIVEKHSLFMLCAAALMTAGCQTDDIYALSGSCPELESIVENGTEICTRATYAECIKNHDTSDALRSVDFEAAFKTNRCPKGFECRAQKHQCEPAIAECEENDTKCQGDVILSCLPNEDGKYVWTETDKKCTSVCTNNEHKCQTGKIYKCVNGQWTDEPVEICTFGCSEGTIQAGKLSCYACGEDEYRCENETLISCEDHEYSEFPCDKGCYTDLSDPDEPDAFCGDCRTGELQCEDERTLSTCNVLGSWDDTDCEFGCQNNACNTCKPGSIRCSAQDSSLLETCDENGSWGPGIPCPFGCQNNRCNDCQPGMKECHSENWMTLRTCNSNGTWESLKCELGCTSGRCNDCEDGNKRCSGSTAIQICENGYWPPPVSCGDQKICTQRGNSYDCMIDGSIECTSGAFKCATCKIDPKKTCSNRCDSNSTWYTDAVCNNGCNEATGKCY